MQTQSASNATMPRSRRATRIRDDHRECTHTRRRTSINVDRGPSCHVHAAISHMRALTAAHTYVLPDPLHTLTWLMRLHRTVGRGGAAAGVSASGLARNSTRSAGRNYPAFVPQLCGATAGRRCRSSWTRGTARAGTGSTTCAARRSTSTRGAALAATSRASHATITRRVARQVRAGKDV